MIWWCTFCFYQLNYGIYKCITLCPTQTTENTYVYQSFGCWMKEWLTPLLAGSFADLLNRNSWSFCFTSVLATAPVRPKDGTKGIGVTLGCWLVIYSCLENILVKTCTFNFLSFKIFLQFEFTLSSRAATTYVGRSPPSGQRALY